MPYERGQVVWGNFDPVVGHEQGGRRPALIISENRFNAASGTLIVMPLTSSHQRASFPFSIELMTLKPGDGKRSWVKPSQIRTMAVERFDKVLGRVSSEEVERSLDAIMRVCGRRYAPIKADNDG